MTDWHSLRSVGVRRGSELHSPKRSRTDFIFVYIKVRITVSSSLGSETLDLTALLIIENVAAF